MVEYIKLKDIENDSNKDNKIDKLENKNKAYKISFKKVLIIALLIFLISSIISTITFSLSDKIAVVPINGVIMTEKTTSIYGTSVSSREIASILYELKNDETVKAVLLDINSPGGSPVASEEISIAIKELEKEKPVYSLISDLGASGAYWVAASTDVIYSSSMSTIGSIGVTSAGLSFEDFIVEHNITYRKLTAGKYKDLGSTFRPQTKEEEEIIQNLLNEIHKNFIKHVATNRNMSIEAVTSLATGEVFLGTETIKNGLTDKIGYYPQVIEDLKSITSNKSIVVTYGSEPSLMEIIGINNVFSEFSPNTKSQILLQ